LLRQRWKFYCIWYVSCYSRVITELLYLLLVCIQVFMNLVTSFVNLLTYL
jgi:hypothetical protein